MESFGLEKQTATPDPSEVTAQLEDAGNKIMTVLRALHDGANKNIESNGQRIDKAVKRMYNSVNSRLRGNKAAIGNAAQALTSHVEGLLAQNNAAISSAASNPEIADYLAPYRGAPGYQLSPPNAPPHPQIGPIPGVFPHPGPGPHPIPPVYPGGDGAPGAPGYPGPHPIPPVQPAGSPASVPGGDGLPAGRPVPTGVENLAHSIWISHFLKMVAVVPYYDRQLSRDGWVPPPSWEFLRNVDIPQSIAGEIAHQVYTETFGG